MSRHPLPLRTKGYVSEFEQFIDGYLRSHPQVEPDRQRGWFIWWDRRPDPAYLEAQREDAVPVKGYPYG